MARLNDITHDFSTNYAELDFGMPRRCAFAVYAEGERHLKLKENLVGKLRYFMPGIDVVEIDKKEASGILNVDGKFFPYFAKMAIPLMRQFNKYDRVIWMDSDIDIVDGMFSGVLGVETSSDGLSMASDINQKGFRSRMVSLWPGYDRPVYFNCGVVVMDLYKIDKESWRKNVGAGIAYWSDKKYKYPEQNLLNEYFSVSEMDVRYNFLWNRKGIEKSGPYAIHYCNNRGREKLLTMLSAGKGGKAENTEDEEDPVDAVFVIGTGSKNGNEELRYALRNLDAHCKFVRNVYICGECPDWVDRKTVTHLKWPDRFRHAKDANIIDKLRHACEQNGIAKRILFCSDDQFQTGECSWDDFSPIYLRKYTPEDTWYSDRHRVWHDRLRDTLERERVRRKEAGLDESEVYYWQPHMWMQIDRDRFIEYAKWSDYEHRKDTIIASGYFNFIGAKGEPNHDHAFIGRSNRMPKVRHIAYTDGDGYESAITWLRAMFPKRCRFEVGWNGSGDQYGMVERYRQGISGADTIRSAIVKRLLE